MSEAKNAILARIRESASYNSHIPNPAPRYEGALNLVGNNAQSLKSDDLLEDFKLNQTNNKALLVETTKENLASAIAQILQKNLDESIKSAGENGKKVLYNQDIDIDMSAESSKQIFSDFDMMPYTKSVDTMRHELFHIPTSIVQARCGIADLGIIALSSNPKAPRLSSLITNTCIYLLPKSNIVPHLFAGVEFVKAYEKARSGSDVLPSNIIFVAGPSRTADIELQTVFGVHGPRKTYVMLY